MEGRIDLEIFVGMFVFTRFGTESCTGTKNEMLNPSWAEGSGGGVVGRNYENSYLTELLDCLVQLKQNKLNSQISKPISKQGRKY